MNILLSTSPHVRHPAVLQNDFKPDQSIMYSFAPVGLLALSAVTRSHIGIEPALYDLNRRVLDGTIPLGPDFYRATAAALCKSQPDLLGFMTECDSYHHVLQICQEVKKIASSTTIVLGGPHASAVSRLTLERYVCVDAIVKGEGERAFPEYVESCRANDEKSVPGVLRRTGTGNILDGGVSRLVENLDDLPIPAYDLYGPDPGEEIFLEVGRGCPFQCTFCSTAPYWNRRHRVKSPERILREAQLVVSLFGTRRVHFTHDLFTTNRAWVRDVCQTLVDAGTPVLWTCSARTDTVDDDLLSTMARAGCNAIYFGIESGSQRILKEIQKDIPIEHSLDIVRSCGEHGISANAGFIAGFPTENEQSLEETFRAFTSALEAGCKPTHIFGFCPFADSTLYSKLGEMDCSGHFLDIPLGIATDEANRKLIASDKDLFGSYFRPRLKHLLTSGEGTISAIDEFSALVDATVIPSLMLAKAEGGMLALFRKWVHWIAARNDSRGAALYRRFYGSHRIYFQVSDSMKYEWVNLEDPQRSVFGELPYEKGWFMLRLGDFTSRNR